MVIRDINNLIEVIDSKIYSRTIKIISVDGINGSGKTYISKILCDKLGLVHFDIDEHYLNRNKGRYVDFVKYKKLNEDLLKCIKDGKIVLIDVVCVLQIFDNIGITSDIKIYVKKLIYGNYWFDGRNMDYTKSIDEIIQQNKKGIEIFSEVEKRIEGNTQNAKFEYREESLFHDVLHYHFKYKPNLHSDIIFERQSN